MSDAFLLLRMDRTHTVCTVFSVQNVCMNSPDINAFIVNFFVCRKHASSRKIRPTRSIPAQYTHSELNSSTYDIFNVIFTYSYDAYFAGNIFIHVWSLLANKKKRTKNRNENPHVLCKRFYMVSCVPQLHKINERIKKAPVWMRFCSIYASSNAYLIPATLFHTLRTIRSILILK